MLTLILAVLGYWNFKSQKVKLIFVSIIAFMLCSYDIGSNVYNNNKMQKNVTCVQLVLHVSFTPFYLNSIVEEEGLFSSFYNELSAHEFDDIQSILSGNFPKYYKDDLLSKLIEIQDVNGKAKFYCEKNYLNTNSAYLGLNKLEILNRIKHEVLNTWGYS